jgi:N-acetylneuraminic acid mutarotase
MEKSEKRKKSHDTVCPCATVRAPVRRTQNETMSLTIRMQKKSTSRSAFFSLRALLVFLLCALGCSIAAGTLFAFFHTDAPASSPRTLTFAERVAYQRAIEEVYWRHRIWPRNGGERPDPKPSLDAVMSQAQLEKKVADYLRKSQALEDYWQRPLTAEQLQAEMDRMAQRTKQPDVLRELFEALGNDPFVIAECLARPALAERLLTSWYIYDQRIHGELKQRSEAELLAHNTVAGMKQTTGKYSEIELVRSDSSDGQSNRNAERAINVNSREWDAIVQKLAAIYPPGALGTSAAKGTRIMQLQLGVLSPLQEDETRYYATAVLTKTADYLEIATVSWLKESVQSWLAKAEEQVATELAVPNASYTLPTIREGAVCIDDSWTPTSTNNPPLARWLHTAVWTGIEMIVWGGDNAGSLDTGGRYRPSTDTWTPTSLTNVPIARALHTAVWTGNEMIIWGGSDAGNTGGRYNPSTDSWIATTTLNAPAARFRHTMLWSGSEVIIWGGDPGNSNFFNTGGRYNPSTNSWTATSTTNAPAARALHSGVWTGEEMIVWGGMGQNFVLLNTGGRYNPSTNSWTSTNTVNAPTGRYSHTAIWSGADMIVWGGDGSNLLNTGGKYNANADSWLPTSTSNAPSGRFYHTSIWTGSQMIIWGGFDSVSDTNTGGRYDPDTNSWMPTTIDAAPSGRESHTAVWTGSEMIIWGGTGFSGVVNTGGRYCAQAGPPPSPTPTPTASPTPTPTPTPCEGRCSPTPRPRPTPAPRPTP